MLPNVTLGLVLFSASMCVPLTPPVALLEVTAPYVPLRLRIRTLAWDRM